MFLCFAREVTIKTIVLEAKRKKRNYWVHPGILHWIFVSLFTFKLLPLNISSTCCLLKIKEKMWRNKRKKLRKCWSRIKHHKLNILSSLNVSMSALQHPLASPFSFFLMPLPAKGFCFRLLLHFMFHYFFIFSSRLFFFYSTPFELGYDWWWFSFYRGT